MQTKIKSFFGVINVCISLLYHLLFSAIYSVGHRIAGDSHRDELAAVHRILVVEVRSGVFRPGTGSQIPVLSLVARLSGLQAALLQGRCQVLLAVQGGGAVVDAGHGGLMEVILHFQIVYLTIKACLSIDTCKRLEHSNC